MATGSIYKCIVIRNIAQVQALIDALEHSEASSANNVVCEKLYTDMTRDQMREVFGATNVNNKS